MIALFFVLSFHFSLVGAVFDPYQDNAHYEILWPGSVSKSTSLPQADSFVVKTAQKERYRCFLPRDASNDENDNAEQESDAGPDPELLLQSLYDRKECSYRLESYWNYELCHGNYVKQYHDDPGPDGAKGKGSVRRKQYYLGYLKKTEDVQPLESPPVKEQKVPTVNLEGKDYPYFAVNYVDGTLCDLDNKGRRTRVLYICHEQGRNEIVLLRETSTCEYEAIVETPVLCPNPAYRLNEDPLHHIHCHSLGDSPSYPRLYSDHIALGMSTDDGSTDFDAPVQTSPYVEPASRATPDAGPILRQFLEGTYCLRGGRGWWHYEFCYQQHVKQYHVARDSQVDVFLGYWDEETHINWFRQNIKKKRASKNNVVHYYSEGDVCDLTKEPRNVQVRLRCIREGSMSQVSIYLEEPRPCEYIVTVEATLLCSLVDSADEDGLFAVD